MLTGFQLLPEHPTCTVLQHLESGPGPELGHTAHHANTYQYIPQYKPQYILIHTMKANTCQYEHITSLMVQSHKTSSPTDLVKPLHYHFTSHLLDLTQPQQPAAHQHLHRHLWAKLADDHSLQHCKDLEHLQSVCHTSHHHNVLELLLIMQLLPAPQIKNILKYFPVHIFQWQLSGDTLSEGRATAIVYIEQIKLHMTNVFFKYAFQVWQVSW